MWFLLCILSAMVTSAVRGVPFPPFPFHPTQPPISLTCDVVSHRVAPQLHSPSSSKRCPYC